MRQFHLETDYRVDVAAAARAFGCCADAVAALGGPADVRWSLGVTGHGLVLRVGPATAASVAAAADALQILEQALERGLPEPGAASRRRALCWSDGAPIALPEARVASAIQRIVLPPAVDELHGAIAIVPFRAGRRPIDEGLYPGTGASEAGGLMLDAGHQEDDAIWLLYELSGEVARTGRIEVRMSAWFVPPGAASPVPVPGLQGVAVPPQGVGPSSLPSLVPAAFDAAPGRRFVAVLHPRDQLLDGPDRFTFEHQFFQRVRIELALHVDGVRCSAATTDVEVFDGRRSGSLYRRLLERLIVPDTRRQRPAGQTDLHEGYHPWYSVLAIGTNKADRYMQAIQQDLVLNQRHLADPSWLLRVGLYLELLTFLGIVEAVRDEYPDLLSAGERRCFEQDPSFAELRARIAPAAWREVWGHRTIVGRRRRFMETGPVDVTNLLRKQVATLEFLRAHHDDLKHAIELAGPNLGNAQETWHRVFRDAERAVLSQSLSAFPELQYLPRRHREFALWHEKGDLALFGIGLPDWLSGMFGDQHGVYPSACEQYRESMNEVAAWAREHHLMDYVGEECVPRSASLIAAHLDKKDRHLAALQARDGYGPTLEVGSGPAPRLVTAVPDDIERMLRKVRIFAPLLDAERRRLASQVQRHVYGPLDRVVVQGHDGASLFLVERGTLEVIVRQSDGADVAIAELSDGDVFGELALLTGKPRTATVQAMEEVALLEISKLALRPLLEERPALIHELSLLLEARQAHRQDAGERHRRSTEAEPQEGLFARMIGFFFFGEGLNPPVV